MIRARIRVDGRFDLQALLGAPMVACSGCGERDGGAFGWPEAGQWRTGAVRLGVEWLAVGPGRD